MSEITEQLTLIEEALVEIINEFRHGGLDQALAHDFDKADAAIQGHIQKKVGQFSDKLRAGEHMHNYRNASKALNAAQKDYETHKANGNTAGMANAKANMAMHKKNMASSQAGLNNAGRNVRIRPKSPTPPKTKQDHWNDLQTHGNNYNRAHAGYEASQNPAEKQMYKHNMNYHSSQMRKSIHGFHNAK